MLMGKREEGNHCRDRYCKISSLTFLEGVREGGRIPYQRGGGEILFITRRAARKRNLGESHVVSKRSAKKDRTETGMCLVAFDA